MLHLPRHLELPHFTSSRELVLSPIADEDDELINSQSYNVEDIVLDGTPDAEGLEEFWSGVQVDLEADPDWVNFTEDEE